MAQILTLLQVRGSPQFAWHPLGYLWVDGRLFRAVRLEPPATGGYQGVLTVKRATLRDGDHTVDGGWRHGEGCRCDLCADPANGADAGVADQTLRPGSRVWTSAPAAVRHGPHGHGDPEKRPSE
jgi:hypothetical protein